MSDWNKPQTKLKELTAAILDWWEEAVEEHIGLRKAPVPNCINLAYEIKMEMKNIKKATMIIDLKKLKSDLKNGIYIKPFTFSGAEKIHGTCGDVDCCDFEYDSLEKFVERWEKELEKGWE